MKGAAERRVQKFKATQVLPVNVAVLDAGGTIVTVNRAWKEFGRRNGLRLPKSGLGLSYLDYCTSDTPNAQDFVEDLNDLLAGRLDLLTLVYPCHSPNKKRWFFLSGVPLFLNEPAGAALLHTNLTNLLARPPPAGEEASKLSRRADIEPILRMNVGAIVERSISGQLATQLAALLGGHRLLPSGKRDAADAARIIADARLSAAQLQILSLLARGKTNAEIAEILLRSPNTIKLHVSAILKQLNYRNRTQAALLASKVLDRISDPAA